MQSMNSTKALTQLGFVSARGLDNGDQGALLLANKVDWILNSIMLATLIPWNRNKGY